MTVITVSSLSRSGHWSDWTVPLAEACSCIQMPVSPLPGVPSCVMLNSSKRRHALPSPPVTHVLGFQTHQGIGSPPSPDHSGQFPTIREMAVPRLYTVGFAIPSFRASDGLLFAKTCYWTRIGPGSSESCGDCGSSYCRACHGDRRRSG